MARVGTGTADIRRDDIDRVLTVLRTGRLSAGPFMEQFEREFAAKHGAKYASMCNSGTGALQLALQAMKEEFGWPDGAEVIVPAMTFVATVNVVLYNNLTPVLVDIEPVTFNMDPDRWLDAVTLDTVAVMPVNLYGQPADGSIADEAGLMGLRVLEDSCETVGSPMRGDMAAYSTYMAHHITTGVGGLALTNSEPLATRFRSLMNHGRDPIYTRIDDDDADPLAVVEARYRFVSLGQSYRATEMEAALGLGQLWRLDEMLRQRRRIAGWLIERLSDLPLQLPKMTPEHSFMMFPIVCLEPGLRDKIVAALETSGVETRPLMPILDQPCYEGRFSKVYAPVTRNAVANGFYVGCHQGMTLADVEHIAAVIRSCI